MGGAARSRKLVSRVAWRATLNEEESRAHLQARLRLLSFLMFSSFAAFLGFVSTLYQFEPGLEPDLNDEILTAALCALAMLLVLWIVLIRKRLSIAALNTIDVVYALGTGTMFASGAYFATDHTRACCSPA
jgi:hypothetical protein